MNWITDPSHSSLEFSVRHMGISTVRGRFTSFEGVAETDAKGNLQRLSATADIKSINTNDAGRDEHLRSADFFDVENHPKLSFESTNIDKLGHQRYQVTGNLSMRGVSNPVTLELEVTDPIQDPFGGTRVAATGSGKLNRKQWGLNWNQVLETGGLLVSEEVKIHIDVQATAAKEEPKEAVAS